MRSSVGTAIVGLGLALACASPVTPPEPEPPTPEPPAPSPAPAPRPADALRKLTVAGGRAAWLHVPDRSGRDPLPLVVVIGAGDGRRTSRFFEQWYDRGVLLAFPSAVRDRDDEDDDSLWDPETDAGLVEAVIEEVRRTELVSRVYAVGYAPGGLLTWHLLCADTEKFDGFAIVSEGMPRTLERSCPERSGPRPVLLIAGTDDRRAAWAGDDRALGIEDSLDRLARRRGCSGERLTDLEDEADDGTTVVRHDWTCRATPLVLLEVKGGGRGWPGSDARFATRDIDGADEILRFFGID